MAESAGTQKFLLSDINEYMQKEFDTVFMLRVLDLEEAYHVTKWHAGFSEPLKITSQINGHGFYVLLGGTFGTKGEYVSLGRPGRCDLFFPPRAAKQYFVADSVGTAVNGNRAAQYTFTFAAVLGCNPRHDADAM